VGERLERLLVEHKQKEKEIESLRSKLLSSQSADLLEGVKEINGTRLLVRLVEADSPKALRDFADRIKERLGSGLIVLGARQDEKAMLLCVVTEDLLGRYKAGQIVSRLSSVVGGKGGGRDDMAQGGGNRPENLAIALETVEEIISR
jgi:alanyl-tRNA synthetase